MVKMTVFKTNQPPGAGWVVSDPEGETNTACPNSTSFQCLVDAPNLRNDSTRNIRKSNILHTICFIIAIVETVIILTFLSLLLLYKPSTVRTNNHDICLHENSIIGGIKSTKNQWPWLVEIRYNDNYLCGGSIIDKHWILSAAHCFQRNSNCDESNCSKKWPTIRSPSLITIVFGDETVNPNRQQMKATEIFIYEGYNYTSLLNDISLVKLAEELEFESSQSIKPIRLDDGMTEFESDIGTVVGRGLKSLVVESRSHEIQHLSIPIKNDSDCDHQLKMVAPNLVRPASALCAGYDEGGRDACSGDSGGPLTVMAKDARPILVGIVSAGYAGCAEPNSPGLYTRVSYFKEWIEARINNALIPVEEPPEFNNTSFRLALESIEKSGLSSDYETLVQETLLSLLPLRPPDHVILMVELEEDHPIDVERSLDFRIMNYDAARYGIWVFKCGMFRRTGRRPWGYVSQIKAKRFEEDGLTPDSEGPIIKFMSYRCPSVNYNLGKQPPYNQMRKDLPELEIHRLS